MRKQRPSEAEIAAVIAGAPASLDAALTDLSDRVPIDTRIVLSWDVSPHVEDAACELCIGDSPSQKAWDAEDGHGFTSVDTDEVTGHILLSPPQAVALALWLWHREYDPRVPYA